MATVVSLLVNTVNPIADAVSYRSGVPEALGHHAAALSELLHNLRVEMTRMNEKLPIVAR